MEITHNQKFYSTGKTLAGEEIKVTFEVTFDREGNLKKQIYPWPVRWLINGKETVIAENVDQMAAHDALLNLVGNSELMRMEGEVCQEAYVDLISE